MMEKPQRILRHREFYENSTNSTRILQNWLNVCFSNLTTLIVSEWARHIISFTYDVSTVVLFALLFVIVDVLSKCYKLRERNRVINLHVIVEEHYERYMDQQEEFLHENPQYRDTISSESSSEDTSCSTD